MLYLVNRFIFKERKKPLGNAEAECGRHAVFHRAYIIKIQPLDFLVSLIAQFLLLLKSLALVYRVIQFTEALANLGASDNDLKAFHNIRVLRRTFCERLHKNRHADKKRRSRNPL